MLNRSAAREVILDISSTVVDESKQIILIEFSSLSTNASLRMTECQCYAVLNGKFYYFL